MGKPTFLLLLLSCLLSGLAGQSAAEERLDAVVAAYERQDYGPGLRQLPALIATFRRRNDPERLARAQLYHGEHLYEAGELGAAERAFRDSEVTVITGGLDSTRLDYYYLIFQGLGATLGGHDPEGVAYYRRMAHFVNRYRPDDRRALADVALARAAIAYFAGDYAAAVEACTRSLELGAGEYREHELSIVYNNLAHLYAEQNDFERALSTQRLATHSAETHRYRAASMIAEAILLVELRDLSAAQQLLDRATGIIISQLGPDDPLMVDALSNYVLLYNEANDLEAFGRVLHRWEELYLRKPKLRRAVSFQRYANYRASYAIRRKDYTEAGDWLRRSQAAEADSGQEYYLATSRLLLHAKIAAERADFTTAAGYLFRLLAYEAGVEVNTEIADPHYNFRAHPIEPSLRNIDLATNRAAMYAAWDAEMGDGRYGRYARRDIALADSLVEVASGAGEHPGFRRQLDELTRALRQIEYSIAWRRYRNRPNRTDLEWALNAGERTKHLGLSERLQSERIDRAVYLPLSVRRREGNFSERIDSLVAQLRGARMSGAEARAVQREVGELRRAQRQLTDSLETAYPTYRSSRRALSDLTVDRIRLNLIGSDETLLHFTEQDSLVYIVAVNAVEERLVRATLSEPLSERIPRLLALLDDRSPAVFTELRLLYRELLEPLEGLMQGRSLVIIPDGNLAYLPFAALLTADDPPGARSAARSYLIRRGGIRHLFSGQSGLLDRRRRLAAADPERAVLAMAPFAAGAVAGRTRLNFSRRTNNYLTRLVGADRCFVAADSLATAAYFLRHAPQANLLHIGTHAEVDNEHPSRSALLFHPGPLEARAEVLASTISDLEIVADLAVVSACSTARGRLYRGRGVVNLGQSFVHAGCGNLVLNLWEVVDETSHYLLRDFYRNLFRLRLSKPEALRRAQLNYLYEYGATAHPAYWATMVYIGDRLPLRAARTSRDYGPILLLSLLLLALVSGAYWMSRTTS